MTWGSPDTAALRTDLPWLRRRTPPARSEGPPPLLRDFVAGHGHHPERAAAAPPNTAPRHAPPSPAPPNSAPPSPPPPSPAPPNPAPPAVSSSLDLGPAAGVPAGPPPSAGPPRGTGPVATGTGTGAATRRAAAPRPLRRRVVAGRAEVLTARAPTVTLTRVQSGMGSLTVEAACSDAVGDLRLAAAYRLSDGTSSLLAHTTGPATAPARGGPPVLLAQRHRFEQLTVDLRQVRRLDRLLVLALSGGDGPLAWGGTLVATTSGGSRVETAMDGPPGPGVVALLSVYAVDGELVLRAEAWETIPTVREACLAHGFDRITWLDARTPVT